MSNDAPATVDIALNFKIAGQPVNARVTLPAGPARPRVMLPIFQGLTDTIVDLAENQTAANDRKISCTKGCGACCRQLVPISQTEAYQLADLIQSFPPERRAQVLSRFEAARTQLETAGMLAPLSHSDGFAKDDLGALGSRYFSLQIACPFLEDESCSIHADRPMVCREYLVTSPAAWCAEPDRHPIEFVKLAGAVSTAVSSLGLPVGAKMTNWVPLILAMHWAQEHPEPQGTRAGPEIFQEVMGRLWGKPTA